MVRKSDLPTHNEIEETVTEQKEKSDEKLEELGVLADDTETVAETLEAIEGSTTEGKEQVESDIEAAEDVTVEIFETEDGNLDDIQDETEDYENELDERHDTSESDLGKISDASGNIETQETVDKLADAKTSTLEEMDFLKDNNEKARDDRNESEQAQAELENRINSVRGS